MVVAPIQRKAQLTRTTDGLPRRGQLRTLIDKFGKGKVARRTTGTYRLADTHLITGCLRRNLQVGVAQSVGKSQVFRCTPGILRIKLICNVRVVAAFDVIRKAITFGVEPVAGSWIVE